MKKQGKIVCIATAAVLALSGASVFVGCASQEADPEQRPFVMAIQEPDRVFNPFFATSQYDSNILQWTQLSMFATDENGNLVCGEDEACVVKDYTSWHTNEENGEDDTGYTYYQIAIKNGIKFSDGEPLTIKDVLFNLYVYLDPAYTGSATVYSTKFEGLEAYRTNGQYTTSSGMTQFEEGFIDDANDRIELLAEYVYDHGIAPLDHESLNTNWDEVQTVNGQQTTVGEIAIKDYETTKTKFREELVRDYTSTVTGMETYYDWGFKQPWQPFLFNDGQMSELLEETSPGSGIYKKDENGNYIFDEDGDVVALQESLDAYLEEHANEATEDVLTQNWAVDYVFNGYFSPLYTGTEQIEHTIAQNFDQIVHYWATADELRTQFTAEARTNYFSSVDRVVKSVSGITTLRSDTLQGNKSLGEECDILQVKIRGVDPKTLWNLAFSVAPMHYYSSKEYVDAFDAENGNFGLPFSDSGFMTDILNAPGKVGLPVGAGPYKASSSDGTPAESGADFMSLGRVYYERNDQFTTVGDGIENAKIKYMQYRVVAADQIINQLISGGIDFGEPSATQENITALSGKVNHEEYQTSGYGYIGINAHFVPNIIVRRAIIKSFNTSTIFNDYYAGGLAEPIYRSMSKASWAYPEAATTYTSKDDGTSYAFDATGYQIEQMIINDGYTKVNGVYQKEIPGYGTDRLDYTFTIAGASTDHPAYRVFLDARALLNSIGFDVKVVQSATALSDLTTGKLEVWAAAWTAAVDPDMYQVYHKDSNATSINNWGYPYMRAQQSSLYSYEWGIVTQLSSIIEQARKTDDQTIRKERYKTALDLVMELAVEFPTYQRKDMFAFTDVLDRDSMMPADKCGPYNGLLSHIWEVTFN